MWVLSSFLWNLSTRINASIFFKTFFSFQNGLGGYKKVKYEEVLHQIDRFWNLSTFFNFMKVNAGYCSITRGQSWLDMVKCNMPKTTPKIEVLVVLKKLYQFLMETTYFVITICRQSCCIRLLSKIYSTNDIARFPNHAYHKKKVLSVKIDWRSRKNGQIGPNMTKLGLIRDYWFLRKSFFGWV